jgi:pyruvate/2-oxoglutarate/acetoin dehydrogenase E1 component
MAEEMRRDKDVFVMGEEVAEYQGAYKVTQGLLQEFGAKRVIDTPITEHGFAGLGIGAALAGLKPVVEFMTFNFAMQAMDQLINSAAKTLYMSGGQMGCQIVFRGRMAQAARVAAQHSQDYSAWYSHIPGLKVIAPSTAADAKGLLKAAIRDPNPVIFLENEILYGHSSPVPKLDDFRAADRQGKDRAPGNDVTIVSWSMGMTYALKAAEELAGAGIDAEVIDLRTLKPMDNETIIASVQKTGRAVTVERAGNKAVSARKSQRASWSMPSIISMRRSHACQVKMCRCPMPQISKSSRCRRLPKSSRRRRPFAIAEAGDDLSAAHAIADRSRWLSRPRCLSRSAIARLRLLVLSPSWHQGRGDPNGRLTISAHPTGLIAIGSGFGPPII